MLCEILGCRRKARWDVTKLFGDRKTLHTCDRCKPDESRRPLALLHLPSFYDITRIEEDDLAEDRNDPRDPRNMVPPADDDDDDDLADDPHDMRKPS